MKIKGRKLGSIIGSTCVAIFSLMAAFSGSIAWFNASRETTISANEFKVTSGGLNVVNHIYFYPFKEILEEGQAPNKQSYYVFNEMQGSVTIQGNSAQYVGNITMDEYSLNGQQHSPVLMLLELKPNTERAIFRAMTASPYMASANGSVKARGAQDNENPLSSVVEFHWFKFTSASLEASKKNGYYALNTTGFTSSNQKSFVRFDANGNYDSFGSDISLFNEDTSGYNYVAIVMDYYAESIEYISSYYLGLAALNDGLIFGWDWELYL